MKKMTKPEPTGRGVGAENCLNVDFMRALVKQYSELGQWTSALFWADAAAAADSDGGSASGNDIWLLSSAMLARGEPHRAAHAVTSRELHRRHLLCLGVAMRSYLAVNEPATALTLLDECDQNLLEPGADQTHNRAVAGVLVSQARALSSLERREAGAASLAAALRADCACYEALHLLLEQHTLTNRQELELIESLPIANQLGPAEGALLKKAYMEKLNRYIPLKAVQPPESTCAISQEVESVRSRTADAAVSKAHRLVASCEWREALKVLDTVDVWCCPEVRTACLVELKKASELFVFAHTLVDAYPNHWTSWFAVGCYYYLIGKSEFARRYLSKAKSLSPGAGCVWLAYGHSFAADAEHDQAMAAYFKASQLMAGCHLPALYVGMECSLVNNLSVCERFLARAAALHNTSEVCAELSESKDKPICGGWERIAQIVRSPHIAHEAGAAAFHAGDYNAARTLWLTAVHCITDDDSNLDNSVTNPRWAPTLDALGHACRKLGLLDEAYEWHTRALEIRPGRAGTLAAMALCRALQSREADAADLLHCALAKEPDDVVAVTLLDNVMDRVDAALTEEEIPQFPFPAVNISLPPQVHSPAAAPASADVTHHTDMSMSFD